MTMRMILSILSVLLCVMVKAQVKVFPTKSDTLYYVKDHNPLYTIENTKGYTQDFSRLLGPCVDMETFDIQDEKARVEKYNRKVEYVKNDNTYCIDKSWISSHDIESMIVKYAEPLCIQAAISQKSVRSADSRFTMELRPTHVEQDMLNVLGSFEKIILKGRHTVRISPKGKREIEIPAGYHIVQQFEFDETINVNSGVVVRENGKTEALDRKLVKTIVPTKTKKSYRYYSDVADSYVMEIQLEGDKIEYIEFNADALKDYIADCGEKERNVFLFPNPSIGEVRIHFQNYPSGDYSLDIHNIIGKRLSSINIQLEQGERELELVLPNLKKGTYIYAIKNDRGERLVTRRLSIITY